MSYLVLPVVAVLRSILRATSSTHSNSNDKNKWYTQIANMWQIYHIKLQAKKKKEKACTLVDVVILADRYVTQKEAENKINTRV